MTAARRADAVVVGGGPAGLAGALRAREAGADVVLVEGFGLGGQLLNLGDLSLPGLGPTTGPDLAATLAEQVMDAGVGISFGTADRLAPEGDDWLVSGPGLTATTAEAVIVATGGRPVPLGVPGEQELSGRGLSTCATCDGPLYAGRPVVVVGGGPRARYEVRHLAGLASSVTVLLPSGSDPPPSPPPPGTRWVGVSAVTDIVGDGSVAGVRYLDEAGEPGEVAADAVFVADRWEPVSEIVRPLTAVDDVGFVLVDGSLRAARAGLFVVGDVRAESGATVLSALSDGEIAALAAVARLRRTS